MKKIGAFNFIILSALIGALSYAEIHETSKSAKPLMHEIMGYIGQLKNYMFSEQKFSDPKNEVEISGLLKKLSATTEKSTEHTPLSKTQFQVSWKILKSEFSDTARIFRT